jgi:transposase-like protein
VDEAGHTIDFLLTTRRDRTAALCFLKKAIARHSVPTRITIDGSQANAAALTSYNAALRVKAFEAAQRTLAGIELMLMLRKR